MTSYFGQCSCGRQNLSPFNRRRPLIASFKPAQTSSSHCKPSNRFCSSFNLLLAARRAQRQASASSSEGASVTEPHTPPATTAQSEVEDEEQQTQEQFDETSAPRIQQQRVQALYDGKYGLPVVRRYLPYEELIRDIRGELIEEIYFFGDERQQLHLEGVCIVKYRDTSLAQSLVPPPDTRIRTAMENHGVTSHLFEPKPEESMLQSNVPFSEMLEKRVVTWLPPVGILVVYGAAQLAAKLKGDAEDRNKLRAADAETAKQMDVEKGLDARFLEAEEMAKMGLSLEEILSNLDRTKVPYDKDAIVTMAATVKRSRGLHSSSPPKSREYYNTEAAEQAKFNEEAKAKKAEEEGESDPMDNAAKFLKLSTAKFTKAVDPEEERLRIKMRAAKRKMKGVNLQYVADRRVFFDDVAGVGEAKVELQEVVDFFTKPELFRGSGARVPRGVLLCGPPGTGKTLLARAVAGESGVAFLSLNASEFVEMFVGVGAARVRDLFNQARNLKPCIIFMDEIDAVGRTRGGDQGNDERDTTLNQLLSEMDGFGNVEETGVIVMAATNRRDVLDPALIRPGRFDRIIYIGAPDYEGRIETLMVHLRGRPVEENIDLSHVAFETAGYTGARLSNLVNTAAGFVGKAGREIITQQDLLDAITWDRTGPERQAPSAERRRRVAVQEAAVSLSATLLPAIEPVQRVTIASFQKLPLGHTILALNESREMTNQFTQRYLREQLLMVLSGRAAEEAVYGHDDMSTVNQRSLAMARRLAQKLVVSGGLTGGAQLPPAPLTISVPIDSAVGQIVPAHVTPRMHAAADSAMSDLLSERYSEASALISRNRVALDSLVTALLEETTLSGDQVRQIVEMHAHPHDLARRVADKALFL